MLNFKSFKNSLSGAEDISHYTHEPHTQLGSNPGGIHTDPSGEKHYVKFYQNHEQARAEVATSHVYEHLGASTLKPRLIHHNGRVGVASKWRGDLQDIHHSEYHEPHMTHELAKHYAAGVMTKNWDVVGNEYDNLKKAPDGKVVSVDQGGALHFRAMGGPKAYTPDIAEHSSYHDSHVNRYSAHAFQNVSNDHVAAAIKSMPPHSDEHIGKIFANSGLKDHQEFTKTFSKRRELLTKAVS